MTEAEAIAYRLHDEIDRIEGLITVQSVGAKLMVLVEDRHYFAPVRAQLLGLAVPEEMLVICSAKEHLIPYPTGDERIMAWVARSSSAAEQRRRAGDAEGG